MNNETPRVSVLMTVRDGEAHLAEAVQSILDQTFEDFELIIYDDGSTDDSARIAEEFAAADPRVVVRHRRPAGAANWLNEGVQTAFSEFIALMGADDVADSERIERQVAHLRAHPECVAVGAQILLVDPERRPIGNLRTPCSHVQIDEELMRGSKTALLHSASILRRSDVLAVGNYQCSYPWAEDLDLLLRLAERGRLANLPESLLEYRQQSEAIEDTQHTEQRGNVNRVLDEARKRRGLSAQKDPVLARDIDPPRRVELWARWARAAIGGGYSSTACHYARRTLLAKPLSWKSWRLVMRAYLGAIGFRTMRVSETTSDVPREVEQASLPQSAMAGRS